MLRKIQDPCRTRISGSLCLRVCKTSDARLIRLPSVPPPKIELLLTTAWTIAVVAAVVAVVVVLTTAWSKNRSSAESVPSNSKSSTMLMFLQFNRLRILADLRRLGGSGSVEDPEGPLGTSYADGQNESGRCSIVSIWTVTDRPRLDWFADNPFWMVMGSRSMYRPGRRRTRTARGADGSARAMFTTSRASWTVE